MMFSIILLSNCMKYIDSVSVRKSDDITTSEFRNDNSARWPITENSTPKSLMAAHRELENLKNTVNDLSVVLQTLEDKYEKEKAAPVMFYAVIRNKAFTYNVDTIIVFETAIVNEGGHYNKYDGVFLAPEKGTYIFAWTVTGISSNYIITELVVEDNVIAGTGEVNSSGGYPSGAMTSLCKMEKGDHAWIRTTGSSTGHHLYSYDDYPQSGFLGLLVFKE
ncbi:multimerin-2-like isoform X2 [Mytilus californianus]|uniref:multimerin-2-like isoform X2 n=1 Tax=Mytilus californianus TaxID=6549 RepID=UPI0022479D37|nr:multimerin-2-like isoform X2 [Mytilus californianus]